MSGRDVLACMLQETTNVKPELQWKPQDVGDTMRYLPRRKVPQREWNQPSRDRVLSQTSKQDAWSYLSPLISDMELDS